MSMTDPIADLLTRIRNAYLSKHDRLDVPVSKVKLEICKILKQEGFIENFSLAGEAAPRQKVRIFLRYGSDGEPSILHLARISTPGRRVYRGADEMRPVLNGLGVGVISTSQGLLTDKQARQRRLGGEVLCEIW